MTTTQAQAESLYTQALDAQERLIRRGELIPRNAHQVLDDSYATVVGTVWIHCTCGDWTEHAEDESQFGYALHVANGLGLKVRMGRAA